jgi:AcrR family transcriptional regulator
MFNHAGRWPSGQEAVGNSDAVASPCGSGVSDKQADAPSACMRSELRPLEPELMDGPAPNHPPDCDTTLPGPAYSRQGDRGGERTRRALRNALANLLRTRDYDDLTVSDILAEADVGRSTFYAHFSSKDDLLRFGLDRLAIELRDVSESMAPAKDGCGFAFVRPLLEHIGRQREMFRRLKGRGATVYRRALDQLLTELMRQAMAVDSAEFDPIRELEVQFAKGALRGMILWWLERNSRLHPHDVEAEFLRLIRNGAERARPGQRRFEPGRSGGALVACS